MTDLAEFEFHDVRSGIVAAYQYKPLPTLRHTRVLVLGPGSNDDNEYPLVASLKLLNLSDAYSEPFEAISYVWGSSDKTHVILVDGQLLRITASLREALLQTRLPYRPRRLWADGICINQSDKSEKGHQVGVMNQIYKASQRTLICLGVQDLGCAQHAASLVDEVNLMHQNILRDPNFSGKPGSFPFPADNDTIIRDSRWEQGWQVMLSHRWFKRGWVVQEASLGPGACIIWASVQIGWTSILRVYSWLVHRGYPVFRSQGRNLLRNPVNHHSRSFARRHPEELRLYGKSSQDQHLVSTLQTLFDAQYLMLSDPRDRIYAFMALDTSDGIFADLRLDPDYERPFWEIYHDFAVKYIKKTGDLHILRFIKHSIESRTGPTLAEAIPSWVPRWDLERRWMPTTLRTEMSDHLKTSKLIQKDTILQVRGLILGYVKYSATQELYCSSDQKSLALQNMLWLWHEVVTASSMNEGPYKGRQAFAFIDVLCPYRRLGTSEEWSTWRRDSARQLQSFTVGPERYPNTSILQSNELGAEQRSLKILAEDIRGRDPPQFVILSRGYYGVAPRITQKGDFFALIYGAGSLSILRPVKGKPGHYRVVGPVYVESKTVKHADGSNMMGGKGCCDWEEWDLAEQEINLC